MLQYLQNAVIGSTYSLVLCCLSNICFMHAYMSCFYWQPMFNSTLKLRVDSFNQAPGTTMFVHWLIGMVYVFYFASFILLLREIFRPGVLWFLRNVNDPEFNPIHEVCMMVYWKVVILEFSMRAGSFVFPNQLCINSDHSLVWMQGIKNTYILYIKAPSFPVMIFPNQPISLKFMNFSLTLDKPSGFWHQKLYSCISTIGNVPYI